jgi:acetyl-CoA carboxylase biotin carboxylase subunit
MKIKKLLVANRGEIALRIMRSAKEMGINTVAVYSEPDRFAPFVRFADEAYALGGHTSAESYLQVHKIIEACHKLEVDAVHPGYGFLSENATFAQAVTDAGRIFIGPSAHAIQLMGNKLAAKQLVQELGIALVPGSDGVVRSVKEGLEVVKRTGFPVLIKAAAGGGGKGMRIVWSKEEFEEQMDRAVSEATASFGDGSVFIEKYIISPKHIEIQVLGDMHGNIVHLFERDCSLQRRHQKVIEEAPSAFINEDIRNRMGSDAIAIAKKCGYYSAGTVEFIMDADRNYYFLEMNTRLQVEHPVTEQITGLDLVKEQIKIAQGEHLSFSQSDCKITGHAIEVRVYAEDPLNNFLPDIGRLSVYRNPGGIGVRIDDGYEEGMDVPIYYDPMLAKITCFGKDRTEAIERLRRALAEYRVGEISTTIPFCRWIVDKEEFRNGTYGTNYIGDVMPEYKKVLETTGVENQAELALALELIVSEQSNENNIQIPVNSMSMWKYNR